VTRATPFSRADVDRRASALAPDAPGLLDPERFKPLAKLAKIADERRADCLALVNDALRRSRLHALAVEQERPARKIAALEAGPPLALQLSQWLRSLPASLRQELRAGDLESGLAELVANAADRIGYYGGHVEPGRSGAAADHRALLIDDLERIAIEFSPHHLGRVDMGAKPREKSASDRRRLRWAVDVARAGGVHVPDEKKHRNRVVSRAP
jgi:hypothetical protein